MKDSRIEITKRLHADGFLHRIDYETKLNQIFNRLKSEDHKYIKKKEKELEQENESKKHQIDYFTTLLKSKINLISMIEQSNIFSD